MRNAIAIYALVGFLGGTAANAANVTSVEPTDVDMPPAPFGAAETVDLLNENFDDTAFGDLPDGWAGVDLTAAERPSAWHISDRNAKSGTNSWWCGRDDLGYIGYGNLWRQNLDVTVDLTDATSDVGMRFWNFVDCEYSGVTPPDDTWDGATMRASADGGTTWEVIEPLGGYPYQAIYAFRLQDGETVPGWSGSGLVSSWNEVTFDLNAYVGGEVMIRFDFASDMFTSSEDGQFPGSNVPWFVDDFAVGNDLGDIYFFDGMETGGSPMWDPHVGGIQPSGDWWMVVDDTHPQPDDDAVSVSGPNGLYCGDPESDVGNGSYYVFQQALRGLDNGIEMPSVDLSIDGISNATLSWQERWSGWSDGSGSYMKIHVSSDGGENWNEDVFAVAAGKSGWSSNSFSLSGYLGRSDVKVRFVAGTGTLDDHYLYWYLDDVSITAEVPVGIGGDVPAAGSFASALHPARPNPFNPRTSLTFSLEEAGSVNLAVFDMSGRRVRTLVDDVRSAGDHSVTWNGQDEAGNVLPSGVYTATLRAGQNVETQRLLMVK